jgi:hypothetical protein
MCPACISTAAILAYGTGATAGAAALVIGARSAWRRALAPRRVARAEDAPPSAAEPVANADRK